MSVLIAYCLIGAVFFVALWIADECDSGLGGLLIAIVTGAAFGVPFGLAVCWIEGTKRVRARRAAAPPSGEDA